jgi:alkylation response protein AidB-like acyl-CoA dehydrogenase
MDYSLGNDSRRLLDDLNRSFAGIAARAQDTDASGALPDQNWCDVVDSGYLRMLHSVEVGGLGLDGVTQVMAMEALARACPSTYWSTTMSGLECVKLIEAHGDLDEHRVLIDRLLNGDLIGCFAVVENGAGSDAGTYRTTVRRDGDACVITGQKTRITNGPVAGLAVVLARLEAHPSGWCFAFVDLDQPGVHRCSTPHMGLRAMPWGGLVFDDVPVRAADVVPVDLADFRVGVAWGWLFISVAAIGIAESALTAAARHAREHVAFGRPLAHMEGVRDALAQTRVEIDAARLLAHRCAWHRARGRPVQELVGMLKPFATEMAVRATGRAVKILGSSGVTTGHPVERYYRDAPMHLFGGLAADRLREQVVEEFGLPVSYQEHDLLAGTGLDVDAAGLAELCGRDAT